MAKSRLHPASQPTRLPHMPDFRAYCVPTSGEPTVIELDDDESHHLVTVNRARVGDPVVAFDGRGREWFCELTAANKRSAQLTVQRAQHREPFSYSLSLAQALPKAKGMDAIVRKATEIGAARIVPLITERTEVHLAGDREENKVEKWRAAAIEAAKQCGNPFVPEITPVTKLAALLEQTRDCELRLVASLHSGATSLRSVLADFRTARGKNPASVLWLVGPEGDFSADEMTKAQAAGCIPVTLGPLVLRCETAATVALGVLSYELQQ